MAKKIYTVPNMKRLDKNPQNEKTNQGEIAKN